jgi:hypothetical protein
MTKVLVVLLEPEFPKTVKVTVFVPSVEKVWVGFWRLLLPPSPKFQDQLVGLPDDVSVNCTNCPTTGEEGVKLKDAASEAATVRVALDVLEPVLLATVSVTTLGPGDE